MSRYPHTLVPPGAGPPMHVHFLQAEGLTVVQGRIGLFDSAFLTQRYRSEFAMLEISGLVQRLVLPLLVAVGSMLGRYAKYAAYLSRSFADRSARRGPEGGCRMQGRE